MYLNKLGQVNFFQILFVFAWVVKGIFALGIEVL